MPKYIKSDNGVTLNNNEDHIETINKAEYIASILTQRLGDKPIELVYDSNTKRTKPYPKLEEQPELAKELSDNISFLLTLLENNSDTFACIYPYYKFIVESKERIDNDTFDIIFRDFVLDDIFDANLEATFLKRKLNIFLDSQKSQ